MFTPAEFPQMFFLITSIIIMLLFNLRMLTKRYVNIYILVIVIKILFLVYQSTHANLPMGGVDWWNYTKWATGGILSKGIEDPLEIIMYTDENLFTRLVAIVYSTMGTTPLYVFYFVFILSLINFRYIILTAYEVTENYDLSQKIGVIWTVWPIAFIHTITFLREGPIMLTFTISLFYFIKYIKKHNPLFFLVAITFSVISAMLHSGMIVILFVYIFIFGTLTSQNRISLSPIKLLLAFFLLMYIMQSSIKDQMMEKFEGIETVEEVIEKKQKAIGNTSYISEAPSSPVSLLLQTPYRFICFICAPFPWQLYSFGTAVSWLLDGVWRLFILGYLIKSLILERSRGSTWQIAMKTTALLVIIGVDLVFCWGTDNFGTAIRHRAKILPLELIFVYWYLDLRAREILEMEYEDEEEETDLPDQALPSEEEAPDYPVIPKRISTNIYE